MGSRIYKLTVAEGEAPRFVAQVRGPEGTWLKNTTSGQQGSTSADVVVYERTSTTAPWTQVYSASLSTATVFPYTGAATGPGIQGDGWTDDPDGYNFLYIPAGDDALFVAEGGHVYLWEFTVHMTGSTNGQSWGDNVLMVEVTVVSRYGQ